MAIADKAVPGLASATVVREVASPVTNYHYTLNAGGRWAAYETTPGNVGVSALGITTPIPNLFQVGAWTGSFGQTGALASGVAAAQQTHREVTGLLRRRHRPAVAFRCPPLPLWRRL